MSIVFLLPSVVFAGAAPIDFEKIINRLLKYVVWPIFLGLVIIMFIYAGVKFLTAQGDPTKISDARKAVIWGIVGIAIAIAAFSAKGLICEILGVTCT